jgi:hypothetical protein
VTRLLSGAVDDEHVSPMSSLWAADGTSAASRRLAVGGAPVLSQAVSSAELVLLVNIQTPHQLITY